VSLGAGCRLTITLRILFFKHIYVLTTKRLRHVWFTHETIKTGKIYTHHITENTHLVRP